MTCSVRTMAHSERQLLHHLSRTPFVDSTELAGILGEPHSTVHRGLTGLLGHGTAHLPSSQRYYLTAKGIRRAGGVDHIGRSRFQEVTDAASIF